MFNKKKPKKAMDFNEIRVVKLSRTAINELLNETVLDYLGQAYFDVHEIEENIVFHIIRDETLNEISFYICKISEDNMPDFDKIDAYVYENVEAVDSAFENNQKKQVYTVLKMKEIDSDLTFSVVSDG